MSSYMTHSDTVAMGARALYLVCDHCKVRVGIVLPANINSLAVMASAFQRLHDKCASEQIQSE